MLVCDGYDTKHTPNTPIYTNILDQVQMQN